MPTPKLAAMSSEEILLAVMAAHDEPHTNAALNLLINTGLWLWNEQFDPFYSAPYRSMVSGKLMIDIKWRSIPSAITAGKLQGSGNEIQILKIACSLAGHGKWKLTELLSGLDGDKTIAVLYAIGQHNQMPPDTVAFRYDDDNNMRQRLPEVAEIFRRVRHHINEALAWARSDWSTTNRVDLARVRAMRNATSKLADVKIELDAGL
jgi:hypothetical protein